MEKQVFKWKEEYFEGYSKNRGINNDYKYKEYENSALRQSKKMLNSKMEELLKEKAQIMEEHSKDNK